MSTDCGSGIIRNKASQSILQDWSPTATSQPKKIVNKWTCSEDDLNTPEVAQSMSQESSTSNISSSGILFDDFAHMENHGELIQQLVNAKARADMDQVSVSVNWKGYQCLVDPNEPPFSRNDFKMHLRNASKCMDHPFKEPAAPARFSASPLLSTPDLFVAANSDSPVASTSSSSSSTSSVTTVNSTSRGRFYYFLLLYNCNYLFIY